MWGLLAVGVGAGALARFPLGTAGDGLVFVSLYGVGLIVLALPLLLAEGALGQGRQRGLDADTAPDQDVADPVGLWPWARACMALAALVAAALVAFLGGWALRYAIASFQGTFFDDPERSFRVAAQGWDAMVLTGVVLVAAFGLAVTGRRRDARPLLATAGILALLAVVVLAAWGLAQGNAARDHAFAFDWRAIDAALVVAALQQSLLPGLVGFGVVATWSTSLQDRALPQAGVKLLLLWLTVTLAVGLGLAAFAGDHGLALGTGLGAAFTSVAAVFAAVGATQGGILAGLFYGALLAGALAATVALLDVPARWWLERSEAQPVTALGATALATYVLSIPLAFVSSLAQDLHVFLLAIVAPLGGLVLSVNVGWFRSEALDGFTFGDARHPLAPTLRPVLRYVLPILLLALLVVGVPHILAETGALARGSGGLWRLVP